MICIKMVFYDFLCKGWLKKKAGLMIYKTEKKYCKVISLVYFVMLILPINTY